MPNNTTKSAPAKMAAKKTATKKTVTTTKKPAARKPATTKNKKLGKGLDAIFGGDISTLIDDIEKRVIELENQQQKLVAEKNELDESSYLMDEFIKAKVNMLEESINARFKLARFKMFNVMLNGNVEECCETTYKGVPYRSMNNAARINVGLDIINALTSYFKVNAPVFIDNAEAVTDFIPVNSQTIKLIVDELEPQLVVKEV